MDIALNPKEDIELRKKARFWAGQAGAALATSCLGAAYAELGRWEQAERCFSDAAALATPVSRARIS